MYLYRGRAGGGGEREGETAREATRVGNMKRWMDFNANRTFRRGRERRNQNKKSKGAREMSRRLEKKKGVGRSRYLPPEKLQNSKIHMIRSK
jgi:hypothetical protein